MQHENLQQHCCNICNIAAILLEWFVLYGYLWHSL